MATAKRDLTDPTVQGPRPATDPLDKLVAMVIRIAVREGLLDEPVGDVEAEERTAGKAADERRSA